MTTAGLDNPHYQRLSWLLLAGVMAGAAWSALAGRWFDVAVLVGFGSLGGLFIYLQDELPRLFTLLFLVAGLVNAAGYALQLWQSPVWFDETVHFYTSFAVMAGLGWLALARTRLFGRSVPFLLAVTGLGLLLGILWEVFEWVVGIIGARGDTIVDLVMDTLGAVAAGLFCAWAAGASRLSPSPHSSKDGASYG